MGLVLFFAVCSIFLVPVIRSYRELIFHTLVVFTQEVHRYLLFYLPIAQSNRKSH